MPEVIRLGQIPGQEITDLLASYQQKLYLVETGSSIPGSYWGDDEAGLIKDRIYARADTPIHSILHEASHHICVDQPRRENLDTNAASDNDEENAVCYLQILLSEHIPSMPAGQIFADMDTWGYSFRLGSTKAWFDNDADDARTWLINYGIIDSYRELTLNKRLKT